MRCKQASILLMAYTVAGEWDERDKWKAFARAILPLLKAEQARALLLVTLYGCTDNNIYYREAHELVAPWRNAPNRKKKQNPTHTVAGRLRRMVRPPCLARQEVSGRQTSYRLRPMQHQMSSPGLARRAATPCGVRRRTLRKVLEYSPQSTIRNPARPLPAFGKKEAGKAGPPHHPEGRKSHLWIIKKHKLRKNLLQAGPHTRRKCLILRRITRKSRKRRRTGQTRGPATIGIATSRRPQEAAAKIHETDNDHDRAS